MNFDPTNLVHFLTCTGQEEEQLYACSKAVREKTLGKGVYLRGLIEISNVCTKDCFYCGIRKSNLKTERYTLSDNEVLEAARYAFEHQYGSIVLQGGERQDAGFIARIDRLLRQIMQLSQGKLGITLSLGEQSASTYRRWFESGAQRYLLRIETSNEILYRKLHPQDSLHQFRARLDCLQELQKTGYQTGTGVMIGLPFQTTEDLAQDLLFFQESDVDMVGMGPYLEHQETPLYTHRNGLLPQAERLRLGLHMISCLRLLMPDINIAATTALQAIDPAGREKAISIGANVIMPNMTPLTHRSSYKLYENKPGMDEGAEESTRRLIASIRETGYEVQLGKWGNSKHWAIKLPPKAI